MARPVKPIYVRLVGTGIDTSFVCRSHDIIGQPADTFHKFVMEDDVVVLYNNFGISCITIADSPEGLR
jgi:hypothetical protein